MTFASPFIVNLLICAILNLSARLNVNTSVNYKKPLLLVLLTQQSLHQIQSYNVCGNEDGSAPQATTSFGLKNLH